MTEAAKPVPRPAKTRKLKSERIGDREVSLKQLGSGWEPWEWQVATMIDDGKDYCRPGQPTLISCSNYLTQADAVAGYERTIERHRS